MKKYLNESEQKRFYQLTRDREKLRAEGKELNNTDLNDYKALDIKRRGGLKQFRKGEDAQKAINDYLTTVKVKGGTDSILERTYKLEEEGLALQNKIKQAKQNLLKKGVLPDNPTDEDIQKVLKSAEIADTALQKLNVKLEGKNFRGQTQEGKRIRERSIPTKDLEGLLDPNKTIQESIDELQFYKKSFRLFN